MLAHGDERVDEWYWLRERDDPDVRALLEAENEFTKQSLAHTEDLQARLYDEIVARIQETDLSVPARKGEWSYYARTVEGLQYPIACRKAVDDVEQVMLDVNAIAEGHDFCEVANDEVSPDASLLAYGVDVDGGERYELRFRDLATGDDLADTVADTYYGLAWAADNRTVFYTRPDDAMRPYQLWRHTLGSAAGEDELVFQEDDERFFLGVTSSKDERFVFLVLESKVTTEVWFLPSDQPTGSFKVIEPRQQGVEYAVEHHDGAFLITTNVDGAENFKLMRAPVASPGRASWVEVVGHRPEAKLDGVEVFKDWLVLWERAEGLRRIRVMPASSPGLDSSHLIEQPEPVYTVGGEANLEFDSDVLRFSYQSMVTPRSVFDYDMRTRERVLLKQQPVLGGYDPSQYETVRMWAKADDGEQVPMSLVYRRGVRPDGSNPALLYGYGSYEHSVDPTFSSLRLSLLDRGMVFAIAHVRGGGEMGRRWYEDGKLLRKRNTFTDFVACAKALFDEGWTAPARLAIRGGSAGGLLMGAVMNMAPSLCAAVIAEVPFVDCLTTILDEDLPLTVLEWEEWGNPVESAEVYDYMKSYSPYDNVEEGVDYPAVLATAGLNDPRVSYWEPAKWVQRLRERAAGESGRPVLLKVELGAGHMGPSGRYDAWRDEAFVYAFLLDALGVE